MMMLYADDCLDADADADDDDAIRDAYFAILMLTRCLMLMR
jgi:hypothetical protein